MGAAGISVSIGIGKQVVDSGVAPETVLSQTPPAGTLTFTSPPPVTLASPPHPSGMSVTLAVPAATECTASQLSLTFTGVYDGASQHLFAGLEARNVSAQWCRLLGPVQLVGLDAAGDPVTTVATDVISNGTVDMLSPGTPPVPTTSTGQRRSGQFYPVGVFWGWIGFNGPDLCEPGTVAGPQVVPSTWRVTLPGAEVLTAPNGQGSPTSNARTSVTQPVHPFQSCRGGISGTGATVRDGQGPQQLG